MATTDFKAVGDVLVAALGVPTVASVEALPVVVEADSSLARVQAVTPSLKLVKQEVGEWFGKAFEQVCAACSNWRYSLPNDDMVKAARIVWLQALAESGITTKAQVNAGIGRLALANRQYLPTVVEFIALCRDTGESRWPDLATAKKEILVQQMRGAADRVWSCRFVAELARRSGSIFHHTTDKNLREYAFEGEYQAVLAMAQQGLFDQPERKAVTHETDPNVAYYFQLLRDFPHMAQLAADHLKACESRGILITIAPENKTGTVTRADVSLVGEKIIGNNPNNKDGTAKEEGVNNGDSNDFKVVGESIPVQLSGAERQLLEMIASDPLRVSGVYLDAAKALLEKLDGKKPHVSHVRAIRVYLANQEVEILQND